MQTRLGRVLSEEYNSNNFSQSEQSSEAQLTHHRPRAVVRFNVIIREDQILRDAHEEEKEREKERKIGDLHPCLAEQTLLVCQ